MNQLYVTFDGPGMSEEGVPVASLVAALEGIRGAMRLMVEHLGGRQHGPGQPPRWVRDQSALRLATARPGSFVAELTLEPPLDGRRYLNNHGPQAIHELLNWNGSESSTLPKTVTDRLYKIPSKLPEGTRLWFGDAEHLRRVEIKGIRQRSLTGPLMIRETFTFQVEPTDRAEESANDGEEALLHGWLNEVNWDERTAQLHLSVGNYVALRFDAKTGDDMRRLATQYVEVRGRGRFDSTGSWTMVRVEKISSTRSGEEPFDLDEFLNDPNPKVFDPENAVTIDLTDEEWESFNCAINEGRDA